MMIDIRLTREERNKLFDHAQRFHLDLTDFEWSESHERYNEYIQLRHRPTGYAFRFGAYDHDHSITYSSDWSPAINGRVSTTFSRRSDQLDLACQWLIEVKREHETPDLWAQLRAETAFLTEAAGADGTRPFTKQEQKLIGQRIDALEVKIVAVLGPAPTPAQLSAVHESLDELKKSAERLTRKDWRLLVLGTITQIIVTLGLEPTKTREILHYFATHLGSFISKVHHLLS